MDPSLPLPLNPSQSPDPSTAKSRQIPPDFSVQTFLNLDPFSRFRTHITFAGSETTHGTDSTAHPHRPSSRPSDGQGPKPLPSSPRQNKKKVRGRSAGGTCTQNTLLHLISHSPSRSKLQVPKKFDWYHLFSQSNPPPKPPNATKFKNHVHRFQKTNFNTPLPHSRGPGMSNPYIQGSV